MRKAIQSVSDAMLGILLMSLALLAIASIFGSCSLPRMSDITEAPAPIILLDTVEITVEKTVTDTIMLPAEAVAYFDSVLCPPSLLRDSIIYVSDSVYLPVRPAQFTVTIRDTVFVPVPSTTAIPSLPPKDMSWPERLTWFSGLMVLLVAWWKKWKDHQPAATA